jgi:predicted amidohydrolase
MLLRVSLAQIDVVFGDVAANLQKAEACAAEAARAGANLLLLPELWSSGLDLEHAAQHAGRGSDAAMADLARRHQLHIYGSIPVKGLDAKVTNQGLLFSSDGGCLAEYAKLHLFRPMDEDRYLQRGDSVVIADTPWGRAGLAICYDLRFPELFRAHSAGGAKLVLIVAEWPYPRLEHWQTLLRARAIENQVFMIACNRAGESRGLRFCGHSCVIDPWGETVVEAGDSEQLVTAEIDLARVDEVRKAFPVLADVNPRLAMRWLN